MSESIVSTRYVGMTDFFPGRANGVVDLERVFLQENDHKKKISFTIIVKPTLLQQLIDPNIAAMIAPYCGDLAIADISRVVIRRIHV